MKLKSITQSYGKTIMMDNYSFKFGVTLTYDLGEEDTQSVEELSKEIHTRAVAIVNDDIKRNDEVMKMLSKK